MPSIWQHSEGTISVTAAVVGNEISEQGSNPRYVCEIGIQRSRCGLQKLECIIETRGHTKETDQNNKNSKILHLQEGIKEFCIDVLFFFSDLLSR